MLSTIDIIICSFISFASIAAVVSIIRIKDNFEKGLVEISQSLQKSLEKDEDSRIKIMEGAREKIIESLKQSLSSINNDAQKALEVNKNIFNDGMNHMNRSIESSRTKIQEYVNTLISENKELSKKIIDSAKIYNNLSNEDFDKFMKNLQEVDKHTNALSDKAKEIVNQEIASLIEEKNKIQKLKDKLSDEVLEVDKLNKAVFFRNISNQLSEIIKNNIADYESFFNEFGEGIHKTYIPKYDLTIEQFSVNAKDIYKSYSESNGYYINKMSNDMINTISILSEYGGITTKYNKNVVFFKSIDESKLNKCLDMLYNEARLIEQDKSNKSAQALIYLNEFIRNVNESKIEKLSEEHLEKLSAIVNQTNK